VVRSIILAAGASSRMGRAKPALPLGACGDTFLGRIIRTLFSAGVPDLIVVVGADPDAVRHERLLRDPRVRVVENPLWQSGQLSSLLAGLDASSRLPLEAALVTLVDVPFVTAQTVECLLRRWRETRAPIVRPARGDEHGHPVIFDCAIFDALRHADPAAGAKAVVRAHEHRIVNVPVNDPGAFQDFDTPDEYASIGH
jgi:CTP:molybdopterin cytidylyltransferase MocA